MKKLCIGALAMILSGCADSVSVYKAESPKFDFITYFTGPVTAWGVIYDWKGTVTKRFSIDMNGSMQTKDGEQVFHLAETFHYTDGEKLERYWDVKRDLDDENKLYGYAPEVPTKAIGHQSGNAIHFTYPFMLEYAEGKSVKVNMDDWMYLVDEDTLVNKNVIRKFGIKVAEIQIFFKKK